jgi:hypothetical protein
MNNESEFTIDDGAENASFHALHGLKNHPYGGFRGGMRPD